MRFTAAAVEKLKPDTTRREVPDDGCPGLYLLIQPSGKKSWAVRGRLHGKPVKLTIGRYPAFDLKLAREEAGALLRSLERDEDPRLERAERKRQAERAAATTVASVVSLWLKRDQAGNRSHDEVKRLMEREVIPRWGKRPIASVTVEDVHELLDAVADRGATTMARRLHAHLHRLFRWSAGRRYVTANPLADLPKPGSERSRDRVLTSEELQRLWQATLQLGYPFGPAYRLLLLTGARKSEVGELRWSEVADNQIELAGARTKTDEPRLIPLSPQVVSELGSLPRVKGKPGWVFTTNGDTPASGWSKAKRRLDTLVSKLDTAGEKLAEPASFPPWRLHDLRRTVATNLQRLGVQLEVTEAVLGHVSGSRAGIVGIYQRYAWADEKRAALDLWGNYLEELAAPQPSQEKAS